jgi:hypothetical protein
MDNTISPRYQMKLIKEVDDAIFYQYKKSKDILYYIRKWHIVQQEWNDHWENFIIAFDSNGSIDLVETLHGINGELLIKIAIDLGVATPDFIPSIANFRYELKSEYKIASAVFEKAITQIEIHPDIAVSLANSALESIIKEIFSDERIKTKPQSGKTLYDLAGDLLKELQLYPNSDMPIEIRTIGSSMLAMNQSIEKLRSEKTNVHGKSSEDYIVEDPLYTYFVVNSVTTVGLFLISFYKNKFPKPKSLIIENDDELPF